MSQDPPKPAPYVDPINSLNQFEQKARAEKHAAAKAVNAGGQNPPGPLRQMSRRDHFAAAALQGVLAAGVNEVGTIIPRTVYIADLLIAKLDEVQHVAD